MILVFSIFLGGVILALTHAIYQPDCALLAAGILVACFLAGRTNASTLRLKTSDPVEGNALLAVAVFFSILLSRDHELLYANVPWALTSLKGLTAAAALLALLASLASMAGAHLPARWVKVALVSSVICLVAARWIVPLASPKPFIDVFWINTWAVSDFRVGKNPYSQIYPDIYKGQYGYQPGFTYWPTYLLAATVPGALKLDLRYLNIICDLSFAGLLGWLASWSEKTSRLTWPIVLLWLAMPVSLFIIEQAWVDPVMLVLAAASILAFRGGKLDLAAILAGLTVATKQYGFIVPALLAAGTLGKFGWKHTIRFCALSGTTAMMLVVPFLAWDFAGFYKNTVQILMVIPMRVDSLTLPAFFANSFGYEIPGTVLLAGYMAVFGGCLWTAWRRPRASTMCYAAAFCYCFLFVMGKQASANYYAVVLGLALLALLEGIQDEESES